MPYKDKEKEKATRKAYYEANKEKEKVTSRAYYEANKEKVRARTNAYKEANKEELKAKGKAYKKANKDYWKDKDPYEEAEKKGITEKTCSTCTHISGREKLPIRTFFFHSSNITGLQSQCKDCVAYANSKNRKGRHTLTREYFIELRHKPCTYCNREATLIDPNSADRIDSSKDYTKNNVQPCCNVCNRMKLDHSHEFFIEHSKRMLEHLGFTVQKRQQTLFGE